MQNIITAAGHICAHYMCFLINACVLHASLAPLSTKALIIPIFFLHRFYCPSRYNDSHVRTYECPVGHYCPPGTWSKHQYPCPAGTINPHSRMTKRQDCLPCPPGHQLVTANDYGLSSGLLFIRLFRMIFS